MSLTTGFGDPAVLPMGIPVVPQPQPDSDLEDFFENGAVALHLVGSDGTIFRANKAELDLLGYTEDEYIGHHVAEFHADADTIGDILARLKGGEKLDKYPARLRAKDGAIKHVLITSSVQFRNGEFLNTRCFTIDVTELKRAQDQLKENEERLRQVLEALPAAIYTTDAAGLITYYNPAAAQLAGREPEIGDAWCVTWRIYTPDGTFLPHDQCPMAVALKENRPIRGVEAVAERPNGVRVPFLPFPTPLRDSAGKLTGAVNMLVDISERKQAETHQKMLLDELNHRVKNNMQMLHSLLLTSEREAQSPEAKTVLANATGRVAAIAAAQKLLYTSNSPRSFDASEFLQAVCASAQQTFGGEVKLEITPVAGKLANDISLPLALILNELLTNAVKYGVNGRGRGTVRVELQENGEEVLLSVTDDGPGFDLKRSDRRSSGLGLVAGLARQIGGKLEVERAQGARCTVRFPKSRAYIQ
jgi:PAS domain S-box-containing protein